MSERKPQPSGIDLMTKYEIRELPTIDDPDLIKNFVVLQEMRSQLVTFTRGILAQLHEHPLSMPTRVVLSLIQRTTDCSLSIETLCLKNRDRDAAILILSLIELRYDIKYIARNMDRVNEWIDHTKQNKKPWPVRSQIDELYRDSEHEAEVGLYRQFSMVKHCNPAGLSFAFPVAATRDELILDTASNNSELLHSHAFALGMCLHDIADAAASIVMAGGLDTGDYVSEISKRFDELARYNQEYVVNAVRSWQARAGGT